MRIEIEFPFIAKNQTANQKNKRINNFYKTILKNKVKKDCETFVYLAKKNYGIVKPFYGAELNIIWHFKNSRGRDYDNFLTGTKYYTDALVSQGLIQSDNHKHLVIGNLYFLDNQSSEKIIYAIELLDEKEFKDWYNWRLEQYEIYRGFKQ